MEGTNISLSSRAPENRVVFPKPEKKSNFRSSDLHRRLLDYFQFVFPTMSKTELRNKVPLWCLIDCFVYLFDCWFEPMIEDLKDDLESHLNNHFVRLRGLTISSKIQSLFKRAFHSPNSKYFVRDSFTQKGKGFPCHVWFEGLPCVHIDNDEKRIPKPEEEEEEEDERVRNLSIQEEKAIFGHKDRESADEKQSSVSGTKFSSNHDFLFSPFSSQTLMGVSEGPLQQHLHHQLFLQRTSFEDQLFQKKQRFDTNIDGRNRVFSASFANSSPFEKHSKLWSPPKSGHPVQRVQFGPGGETSPHLSRFSSSPVSLSDAKTSLPTTSRLSHSDSTKFRKLSAVVDRKKGRNRRENGSHRKFLFCVLQGCGVWLNTGNTFAANTMIGFLLTVGKMNVEDVLKHSSPSCRLKKQISELTRIFNDSDDKYNFGDEIWNRHGGKSGNGGANPTSPSTSTTTTTTTSIEKAMKMFHLWYIDGYTVGEKPNFPVGTFFCHCCKKRVLKLLLDWLKKQYDVDSLQFIIEPSKLLHHRFEILFRSVDWEISGCDERSKRPMETEGKISSLRFLNPLSDWNCYMNFGFVRDRETKADRILLSPSLSKNENMKKFLSPMKKE